MKLINSLFIVLLSSIALAAQQPVATPLKPVTRCRVCMRRIVKPLPPARAPEPQPPAEFFVGEARVNVTKDETVVRLAMAKHGSVLIELPANDGPRYIIPGDPEMATVDQKALERNKRAIVVRPGEQFLRPPRSMKASSPAATVTAQMRSGLVVTFLFYPVEDLAQNVHRCVLTYSRDEVVARRRAAGLPVNLDGVAERGEITAQSAATITISVENPQDVKIESNPVALPPTFTASPSPTPAENEKTDVAKASSDLVPSIVRDALENATKNPKQFKKWTKPVHGLSLAILEPAARSEGVAVLVVAIRNKSSDSLKLAPGSPDLLLEMVDERGQSINLQSLKTLSLEGGDASGVIAAGATTYYALAYRPPVLTTRQQLKAVVAQTSAADEPVSIKVASQGGRR
jgi:hypothetical protein